MISRNGTADFHEGLNQPSGIARIFITGYYDGPTDGVLQIGISGPCYRFDMVDPENLSPDIRRFELRRLSIETMDKIVDLLTPFHKPSWPAWCPNWTFPSECVKGEIEERLDVLMGTPGPPAWHIETGDYFTFQTLVANRTPAHEMVAA